MIKIKVYGEGAASVRTSAKYEDNDPLIVKNDIKVTQDLNLKEITHNRKGTYEDKFLPTGVIINNKISTLETGKEWVLIAHVIPAYWLEDNLVSFKSSDPDVCSVSFGVLKANKPGTATITATAIGTDFTDSFALTVKAAQSVTYTADQTYQLSEPNTSDTTAVTKWLLDGIKKAGDGGYKRLLLPDGKKTYKVTPEQPLGTDTSNGDSLDRTCCYIPSNLCIDLNGCTIRVVKSVWSTFVSSASTAQGGYVFFSFGNTTDAGYEHCWNSSIINGVLMGENDLLDSLTSGTEATHMVEFRNCTNCGLDSVEVCNSPGFNIVTSCSSVGGVGGAMMSKYQYLQAGGLADDGGNRDEALSYRSFFPDSVKETDSTYWLNCSKWDKTKSPYYMCGSVWAKVAEITDTTLYDIIWFDKDNKVIEVDRNNLIYYPYVIPDNADHVRFVAHQSGTPTASNGAYDYMWMPIMQYAQAYKCYIRNCKIHDNTSTGLACTGGAHNVIENCTFVNNGFRDPSSHIDFEDHGDTMYGTILNNCTIGDGNGSGYLLFVIARHVAMHDCIINCYTNGSRNYGFRCWANRFYSGDSAHGFGFSGDCIFAYNATSSDFYHPKARNKIGDQYPGYYKFYAFDNARLSSTGQASLYNPSGSYSLNKTS